MQYLDRLKSYIDETIKEKNIKISKYAKDNLKETIDAREELFKDCLSKVNYYVYHSFYFVFFFSVIGIGITSIYELDLFKISSLHLDLGFLLSLIHLLAFTTLYLYSRAAFTLILYTKIDYEYLEKLARRIDDVLNFRQLTKLDDEKESLVNLVKRSSLRFFFFPIFLIFNKKFKFFFYRYYSI